MILKSWDGWWSVVNITLIHIFYRFMARYEFTGSVWDARKKVSGWKSTFVADDNRKRVRAFFEDQPIISIRQVFQQLKISKLPIKRLTKQWDPYKIQKCQPVKEGDTVRRRDFANHIVEELQNRSIRKHKIWFSDKAYFQLNGYLNKHTGATGVCKILISVSSRHCMLKGSQCGVSYRRSG